MFMQVRDMEMIVNLNTVGARVYDSIITSHMRPNYSSVVESALIFYPKAQEENKHGLNKLLCNTGGVAAVEGGDKTTGRLVERGAREEGYRGVRGEERSH